MTPSDLRAALIPGLLALCAGCITIGGGEEPREERSFDLTADPAPPVPCEAAGPEILLVEPFTVDAAIDREELVWRRGEVESGAWEHYRWVRPAEQGVREILAAAVRDAGLFAVVATDPPSRRADYHLRGHLARCEEADAGEEWTGRVEVHLLLTRVADGEEVLRRSYHRQVPAAVRHPVAVVEAIRAGLDGLAADLVEDLGLVMASERAGGP